MDGIALKQLAESIRAEGVLQPLFVRKLRRGKYEIVAGERRWHAAKIAGLEKVPVVIRDVSDKAALAIALIENLRREDLNPIDQALAIRRLIEEFAMTHQGVADTIGRSRATVTNLLRLLLLPGEVKALVADGKLDMGHARALLSLPSDQQVSAAQYVVVENISVREVESLAKGGESAPAAAPPPPPASEPEWLTSSLGQHLGRGIGLKRDKQGGWRLNIAFNDVEELRDALRAIDDAVQSLELMAPADRTTPEVVPRSPAENMG